MKWTFAWVLLFLVAQAASAQDHGDRQTWNASPGGGGTITNPLVVNQILPKNLDGTDSIGAFNGARNGEINLADQPGFSNSMENISCTTVGGNATASCSGLGATLFVQNQPVAIYAAGPTPTGISTPAVTNSGPVHTTTSPDGSDFSVLASGCQVQNAYFWTTLNSTSAIVSNPAMVSVGDVLSVAGAFSSVTVDAVTQPDSVTFHTAATGTVSGIQSTGASCSTTRHYRAYAIDAKGGMIPSADVSVANTANAQTWTNYVDVLVTVQANATAYALASCPDGTGVGCNFIDVEVPNYSYSGTPTNWWNYDILYGRNSSKAFPTKIMLHDFGIMNYGYDYSLAGTITGGNAPSAVVPQILFTTISAINGNSITYATAPTQTGSLQMVHDMGPVMNSAIAQACNGAPSFTCGTVFVPNYRGTGQGYSIVTPMVAANGFGLRIISDGPTTPGDYSKSDPATLGRVGMLNYRGPLGGTGLLVNNEGRFYMENLNINGITTMGPCLDIDEFGSFTVTTTVPSLNRISCGQASVGYRLGNINTGNIEFGHFQELYANAGTNVRGGIGMLVNSGNALRTTCVDCQLGGNIGLIPFGGISLDGGQVGGPTNFISIWQPRYLPDKITVSNQRMEFATRVIYSLDVGGSQALTAPIFTDLHFQSMELPYDGVVFALQGSGSPTLIGNDFASNTSADGFCTDPQLSTPNNMFEIWQSAFSTITSLSNNYFALSTPYGGTGFTNVPWFGTDKYQSSSGCSLTAVPQAAGPTTLPTLLQVSTVPSSVCSSPIQLGTTSVNAVGWNGGNCTFSTGGTATFIPSASQIATTFMVNLNNSLIGCAWVFDGTNPPTLLGPPSQPGSGIAATAGCSNVIGTSNSLNFYKSGSNYVLQDNVTGVVNLTHVWNAWSGLYLPNVYSLSGQIVTHTLTGATPAIVANSAAFPSIDIESLLLSINVTSMTLPAATSSSDGEIIHTRIRQPPSGGPFTLPSATVGPFTAGAGTIIVAATGVACPTIGTTQSASVPSELWMDAEYESALTEWLVTACIAVR